jgi:hopanoid biosynthesis associated protein HpnK
MTKLIVAADDFGLTAGVNNAIAAAHRDGIVTAASLLVNGPAFESAVDIARNNGGLDLGLHLNLTEGHPVSDPAGIPGLANAHGFLYRHPVKLALSLLRRRVSTADLEREIRSQIEKALGSGLPITHIDGHKHVHAIPPVLRLVSRIAPEYRIHAVRSLCEEMPRLSSMLARSRGSRLKIMKQWFFGKAVSAAWHLSQPSRRKAALIVPERFYGITQTGFLDLAAFADIVNGLSSGINELMCHPGYVDDALNAAPTRLLAQRQREFQLLICPEVRSVLEQARVTLISYKDLVEDYGNRNSDPLLYRYSAM